MNPAFTQKLGFHIRKTNVKAQKIDSFTLEIFEMIIANLELENKADRSKFFQKTFFVADTKFETILEMLFLKISNADMSFGEKTLIQKSYTINKTLSTIKQVQIVDSKEFIIAALDVGSETFVVHVTIQEQEKMLVHFKRQAQVRALIFNEAPIKILAEYSDYNNVFLVENAAELLKHTGINDHAIKLEESKQPRFEPIYNLGSIKLKNLKIYIKINLANNFIQPSKSPANVPILFDWKPNRSFRLCVNYCGLNNIIIKNQYLLRLIGKSLDRLSWAKRFTQLDFTNAYHWIKIHESDKQKTAFQTRYGHFKYQVMLFGLSNTPATFQGYVNKILTEKLDIFVIIYLDDIFIYTEDSGQPYLKVVCWVLSQLENYSFFANLKK